MPSGRAPAPVRFYSSRAPDGPRVPFDEALLRGLAPEGGLYLPDRIPRLTPEDWEVDDPAELGVRVLSSWLADDGPELADAVREALSMPFPLRALSGDRWLLELFHGPTASFKDVGARVMAGLAERALRTRGERLTVLVATSGDTGSAVADGFSGREGIDVVLLFPREGVSPVQEAQLAAARPGVRAYAVEGDFDACQRLVKGAFADPALGDLRLSSANSINVGRLLPQALYYLWAGSRLARANGRSEPPRIVVPSGNLGNLTAGLLAGEMGLPVARWVAAHNANVFFPSYLAGGRDAFDYPPTERTLSNAMDVGAPSNFERLHALFGQELRTRVRGVSVDDAATLARMRTTAEEEDVLVCPHTAVGLEGAAREAREAGADDAPTIVLATAHPAKFPDAVRRATGREPPTVPALEAARRGPRRVEALEARPEALRDVLLAG